MSERDQTAERPEESVPGGYRARDVITGLFVAALLVSNVITVKPISFFGWPIDAGTMLFPVTYIFGDILTEVYGFAQARRVIWIGLGANVLLALCCSIAVALPADPTWPLQDAYRSILGATPRIVAASLVAYWCGEFANSMVLSKLKVATKGRFLWVRTIGSTLVGQTLDSGVFVFGAFLGAEGFTTRLVVSIFLANVVLKTAYEALATPLTYATVGFLKKLEGLDAYDREIPLTPFRWRA